MTKTISMEGIGITDVHRFCQEYGWTVITINQYEAKREKV